MTEIEQIVEKLKARTRVRIEPLRQFYDVYDRTIPILSRDTRQFGEALRALSEVKNVLDEIQSEMSAGLGHLEEEGEALAAFVDGHANDVTILANLKAEYFINLAQTLEMIDDDSLRQALQKTTAATRAKLAGLLAEQL